MIFEKIDRVLFLPSGVKYTCKIPLLGKNVSLVLSSQGLHGSRSLFGYRQEDQEQALPKNFGERGTVSMLSECVDWEISNYWKGRGGPLLYSGDSLIVIPEEDKK
ncbi:hypothetical protein KA107_03675 [Candidatus Pacearchaeota archaeon]|nr:hypothetical protein [Candidatus Pacearchaeota archaeon]